MRYCLHCGVQLPDHVNFCPNCGAQAPVAAQQTYPSASPAAAADDEPTTILKVACFFVPVVGLILYCLYQNDKPNSAKAYGKMALIGWIVSMVIGFVIGIIGGVLMAVGNSYAFSYYSYLMANMLIV